MKILSDFLSQSDIDELHKPLGEAAGLPGRVFGREFYELEQRTLFPRTWCPVAFASDVPEPGDAHPVELAGWPILILRGKDKQIRAFLNICRHRAMRLVTEPCKGRSTFTCPWHAWTYDLEGKLVATPKLGGERQNRDAAMNVDGLGLKPVRVAQWLDMLFVNIDGNAPPFEEHVRPLNELLEPYYDLSTLVRAESWSTVYEGNWKVAVETVLDEYHIPFAHPQLTQGIKHNNNVNGHRDGLYMMTSNARIYSNTRESAKAMGYQFPFPPILKPSAPEPRSHFITIFPVGAIQTRPNHALLGLFLPDGPEKTNITFVHYYPGDSAHDPASAAARADNAVAWKEVFAQDVPFALYVHKNHQLRDDAGIGTRMAPAWEECVASFYRSMIDVMRQ
jgi:choline monooxygenase